MENIYSRILLFQEAGWPQCAYSLSKVAVNAYTRILQTQLEEESMESVVVNAIHPGSRHSKISQARKNIWYHFIIPFDCQPFPLPGVAADPG